MYLSSVGIVSDDAPIWEKLRLLIDIFKIDNADLVLIPSDEGLTKRQFNKAYMRLEHLEMLRKDFTNLRSNYNVYRKVYSTSTTASFKAIDTMGSLSTNLVNEAYRAFDETVQLYCPKITSGKYRFKARNNYWSFWDEIGVRV